MATVLLNPLFSEVSGRIGGIVFYCRKNRQCMRTYVLPRNPDTIMQRIILRTFANAVKSWQALTDEEKYRFTGKARGLNMSGYNLYISQYMKEDACIQREPEKKHSSAYQLSSPTKQRRILSVSDPFRFIFRAINILYPLKHGAG
ncbi:MAG: hypothetical protein JXN64_02105 [Spirochaetes bacterium]|nr:hypothetical protein [Spirochaetota bacterium]